MRARSSGRRLGPTLIIIFTIFLCAGAHAQDGGDAAEALALTVWFEGLPYADAAAITPDGSARLVELLADSSHARHHANVLTALGIAAHPGAYEALAAYAAAHASGEVDAATYRALRSLPLAMGHLAAADDRAVAWLAQRARTPAPDPGWGRGPMHGMRLSRSLRQSAINGLGMAGRPEADAVLDELSGAGPGARTAAVDPAAAAMAAEARAFSARISAEGRESVFAAEGRATR